jgi:hypothetical protein
MGQKVLYAAQNVSQWRIGLHGSTAHCLTWIDRIECAQVRVTCLHIDPERPRLTRRWLVRRHPVLPNVKVIAHGKTQRREAHRFPRSDLSNAQFVLTGEMQLLPMRRVCDLEQRETHTLPRLCVCVPELVSSFVHVCVCIPVCVCVPELVRLCMCVYIYDCKKESYRHVTP